MLRVGYMQFLYKEDVLTFASVEQAADELNRPLIEELKSQFNVSLDGFQEIEPKELMSDSKPRVGALSLLDIVTTSCQDGCVGRPAIFLKNAEGYMLFQTASGEHHLLTLIKQNGRWLINKTETN
jgi:hypothetical protein